MTVIKTTEKAISKVATARMVGLISSRMPAHICRGMVCCSTEATNSTTTTSSNEVTKANSAPEIIPGVISGMMILKNTRVGEPPNISPARVSEWSKLIIVAVTVITIEAARAGEAGKRFAVVASEVKILATQTAKATEEIGNQIGGIQSATQASVQAIQGISQTISEINEISSAIAAAVEEQGAATQEIARNVDQASAGTSDVTVNITSVNSAATETGQTATEVLAAADNLSKQSEQLSATVTRFLKGLKAA